MGLEDQLITRQFLDLKGDSLDNTRPKHINCLVVQTWKTLTVRDEGGAVFYSLGRINLRKDVLLVVVIVECGLGGDGENELNIQLFISLNSNGAHRCHILMSQTPA